MQKYWESLDFVPWDNQKGMESNARIIEWEDGSKSLAIGEDFYDIDFSE